MRNLTKFGEKYCDMMGRPPGIVVRPGEALGGFYGEKFFSPIFEIFEIFFSKCSQSGMVNLTNVKFGYVLETT